MPELEALPLADTSDMLGVHRVFRDAVASGPRLVASAEPGDRDRAEFVATYYDNVLRLLHGHHEGEDELMTPVLVQRCAPAEAAEVSRIAEMHQTVLGDLEAAESRVAQWRAEPTEETAQALVDALATLDATLCAHLDEEERVVLPIAARHMNVAEWGRLPEHGMRTFTGDKLWLVIGLIQEQMPAEMVAVMEVHMPPPLADFWTSVGRRMFADYVAMLRN